MNSKITIITPSFNRAHTLERVFKSIENQSFRDLKWIVMDDGSTDETKSLVEGFQKNADFEIDYYYNENQHKFHTVFEGVRKVTSPYFVIWDSDDAYPSDSLQILYQEITNLPDNQRFIAVMGLCAYENGELVGDKYPEEVYDGFILNIRYKYKVRGDKNGIFNTSVYKEVLAKLDTTVFKKGVYIPYSVFYNLYDSLGYKTRFINKVVRYYWYDENDHSSVSNTRWSGKNRYGLMVGHLSFVNDYGEKLLKFPKALVRNLIGYQVYALAYGKGFWEINKELKHYQFLAGLLLPFSWMYSKWYDGVF